ncbi:MAG: hypothetical protein Q9160_009023 [Pyrenula sp. 1 TL-2023]
MNGIVQSSGQKASGPPQDQRLSNGLTNGVDHSPDLAASGQNGTKEERGSRGHHDGQEARAATNAKALQHFDQLPPELQQVTLGFLPLAKLINRSVQQCWNGFEEMINELADIQVPQQAQHHVNGSNPRLGQPEASQSNQSEQNLLKKDKILNFAQHHRDWSIKLLVLSKWSRNVDSIRRAIDIRTFLDTQKNYINHAAQYFGYLKRDLALAQIPNPDLKTAAEVLSTGRVSRLPDLGYIPPEPLSAKNMLRVLRKTNRLLCTRLVLHDILPPAFQYYNVHDGRVTFSIPAACEIDLSIADEDPSSQFFFIDFRFIFSPATAIADDGMRSQIEARVNAILGSDGLTGCYEFLHDIALSYKLNVLRKQAIDLQSKTWTGNLRVDFIRRTLVVQYWISKQLPKSWIEIGISSGRQHKGRSHASHQQQRASLAIRWLRHKQEIKDAEIVFDVEELSMENILRSVIALHTSWILDSTYNKFIEYGLYKSGALSLDLNCSFSDPGDCSLEIQVTASRLLTVCVEPITGSFALKPTSPQSARATLDLDRSRNQVEDTAKRLAFTRCVEAEQDLSSAIQTVGWESVRLPRTTSQAEVRQLFPKNMVRFILFRQPSWDSGWLLAATLGMDGDHWWIVKLASNESDTASSVAEKIEGYSPCLEDLSKSYFARLDAHIQALIALRVNVSALKELGIPATMVQPPCGGLPASLTMPQAPWQQQLNPAQAYSDLQLRTPFDSLKTSDLLGNTIRVEAKYSAMNRSSTIIASTHHNLNASLSSLLKVHGLRPFQVQDNKRIHFVQKANIGERVIKQIYEGFQRLTRLLACLDAMIRYPRLGIKSISLSQITFQYPKDLPHTIALHFNPQSTPSQSSLEPHPVALSFSSNSPYCRIHHALIQILRSQFTAPSSLDTLIRLLQFTLPLLLVFDNLQHEAPPPTPPSSGDSFTNATKTNTTTTPPYPPVSLSKDKASKFHIIPRSARNYLIRFIRPSASFEIQPKLRDDGFYWALKYRQHPNDDELVAQRLQERVFSISAETLGHEKHWVSLDYGAACRVERPEELIKRIWEVLKDVAAEMEKRDSEVKKQEQQQQEKKPQDSKAGGKGGGASGAGGGGGGGTKRAASQSPTMARKKVNQGPAGQQQSGAAQARGGGNAAKGAAAASVKQAQAAAAAAKGGSSKQQAIEID